MTATLLGNCGFEHPHPASSPCLLGGAPRLFLGLFLHPWSQSDPLVCLKLNALCFSTIALQKKHHATKQWCGCRQSLLGITPDRLMSLGYPRARWVSWTFLLQDKAGVRFPHSEHLCEASPDLPACWQILYLLHSNFRSSREFLKLPRGIEMQPSAADVLPRQCVTPHGVLAPLFAMQMHQP